MCALSFARSPNCAPLFIARSTNYAPYPLHALPIVRPSWPLRPANYYSRFIVVSVPFSQCIALNAVALFCSSSAQFVPYTCLHICLYVTYFGICLVLSLLYGDVVWYVYVVMFCRLSKRCWCMYKHIRCMIQYSTNWGYFWKVYVGLCEYLALQKNCVNNVWTGQEKEENLNVSEAL